LKLSILTSGLTVDIEAFNEISNTTSTFIDPNNSNGFIHLQLPTLNITVFDGTDGTVITTIDGSVNQTFDQEHVEQNGMCISEKTYQWGFSATLLVYAIILTTL